MRHVAGVEEMKENLIDAGPDALVWLRPEKRERPIKGRKNSAKKYTRDGAEGGRCERPEQVTTTRTLQADPVTDHGDRS